LVRVCATARQALPIRAIIPGLEDATASLANYLYSNGGIVCSINAKTVEHLLTLGLIVRFFSE